MQVHQGSHQGDMSPLGFPLDSTQQPRGGGTSSPSPIDFDVTEGAAVVAALAKNENARAGAGRGLSPASPAWRDSRDPRPSTLPPLPPPPDSRFVQGSLRLNGGHKHMSSLWME